MGDEVRSRSISPDSHFDSFQVAAPRITRKSDRRKVSDRTMVGTAQLLCLPALGTDGRRSDSMMNLRKKKTHSVSFHDWGWTARPFSLRFAAAGEAFVLTSLFIERDYRKLAFYRRVRWLPQYTNNMRE